ncbi:MAG: DUF4136 domain-containing protein [Pseudomonadota bacterium]|uniref:DUF4136 domain-containing protein n=1 Tax=Herminiimonas arsenitoxidans TaxID=1809410 RepID=UPI000970D545|nr:DUF4136 domain-containing protein [Herminiimonas arsenitoxidans]
MKRWLLMWVALSSLLLSGCASVIRTDVIAFHDWPADLQNKTYVFDHKVDQNNLEEKSYENLVRTELTRLGFVEAAAPNAPNLKVALKYKVDTRDVRTVQPYVVDPYWYGPYYGPGWRYGPYYDPFWYPGPITQYRDVQYQVFDRQLNILITRFKDGKKLYDVTVHSSGGNGSLAFAMPYLVRAAFTDFPGKNGVPRRIDLEIKE